MGRRAAGTRRTFRVRRRWLETLLAAGDRVTVGHGYTGDGTLVAEALATLGIDGLSARQLVRAIPRWAGRSGLAACPHHPARAACRPTLALILRLPLSD